LPSADSSAPVGVHAPPRPFVCRDGELQLLAAGLEDALAGRTGFFLVAGEPGIGKTRLVDELGETAAARGFSVLRGGCWEAGGAPPYWPWIQILRRLGGGDELVARLLSGASGDGALQGEQVLLFDAVASRLAAAAVEAPLLILLEDLHAADHASLHLGAFVAGGLRGARALLVGTHREGEAWLPETIAPLLGRIARHARSVSLQRLDRAGVALLLQRAGTSPPALAGDLHAVSGGNPLFVHELLRIGWGRTGASALPDGLAAAIREHLGAVAPAVRELLEVAAAIGRECGVATLSESAAQPPEVVAEAMAAAVRAGLVDEKAAGRWAFSHGLVRDVLHRQMAPARRADLHRRAADALERLHTGDPSVMAEVAHHLLAAGPSCAERALDAAVRAAERARRVVAHDEEALLLARALDALAIAAPADVHRRAELLLELAHAQARAGDGRAGRETSRKVCELARELDDGRLLARAALGYGAEIRAGITDPALVRLLEEALSRVGQDPAMRARLLARLAGALQPALDPWPVIDLAREAIAHAQALGDPEVRLAVLRDAGAALFVFAPPAERIPLDQELVLLAAQQGDQALVLRGRIRLVFDHMERASPGDEALADEQLRACQALAAQLDRPHLSWPVLMLRAMRDSFEGRFADGEERIAEALRVAERGRDPGAGRCALLHRFSILRLRGCFEEAAALLPEVIRSLGSDPGLAAFLEVAVWPGAGDPERARPALGRIVFPGLVPDALTGVIGTDACVALGDRDLARRLHDALLPAAGTQVSWGASGMYTEGPVDGALMRLAVFLGDWPSARRHADSALSLCRRLYARPHEAWIQAHWGAALLARGEPAERAAGQRLLTEAGRTAAALDMPGLARLVERGAAEERPRAAPRPAADASAIALEREGEFWTASGGGELCRLKDSGGLRILAELLARPGREVHVLDLVSHGGPVDRGDGGELLDSQARGEITARLEDLRDQTEAAEARGDQTLASRARAEAAALTSELARALGLGGRARRAGSASERARVNVQRQVAGAIRRIREAAPGLGRHLAATVRTGTFCSYEPLEPRRSR